MREYIVPFLAYALSGPIVNFFAHDLYISYAVRTFLTGFFVLVFWKEYKLRFRADLLSFITGVLIFFIWIFLDRQYVFFGESFESLPQSSILLLIKLLGFLIIAPLIEELFMRGFLIRFIIDTNWKKVPVGKFTWASFLITSLLFGISHNRWLAGIVTGIVLNLLLYRSKKVESCIFAHFIANLLLAIHIFATDSWYLW